MINLSIFGEKLKELIIDSGLSAEKLANEIRLQRVEIYHWGQGKYFPSLENLLILADYFKVSLNYLLGIDPESKNGVFKTCPTFCVQFKNIIQESKTNLFRLSKLSGVDRKTMQSWQNGKRMPQADALSRVAAALNISIDYLVGRES